jgi:hypothetical protein
MVISQGVAVTVAEEVAKRGARRYSAAFRSATKRAGISRGGYALLRELWVTFPQTQESLFSSAEPCEGPWPLRRSDPLHPERLEEALRDALKKRLIERVQLRRRNLTATALRITPRGCKVFETVQEDALGPGAWLTCHKFRRLSMRRRRVMAVDEAGLLWAILGVWHEHFVRRVRNARRIGRWRYNEHKLFKRGVSAEIVLGKRYRASAAMERARDPIFRAIYARLEALTRDVPPYCWWR